MKRYRPSVVTLITTLLVLCSLAIICFKENLQPKKPSSLRTRRVAFMLSDAVSALETLVDTTTKYCALRGLELNVKKFYHYQNNALLKSQIEEAIAWKSEAIISIGITAAQGVHTYLNKRKNTTPHIFTCIPDPVILGISKGKYFTGSNSTGVAENTIGALDVFTNALIHLRPDIKKIVVFHSNTPLLAERTAELAISLSKKNIRTENVITSNAAEIREFTRTKISPETDVVLLLRDGNMLRNLQEIVKKCRSEGVSCITSDSKSVTEGAVAAICVEEEEIALLTAKTMVKVLKSGISAESIPITYFNTASLYRIYIDRHEMKAQGMDHRNIAELLSGTLKVEFVR